MLQLFLTITIVPLEQNILRKCVISEGFIDYVRYAFGDVMWSWRTSLPWATMEEHQGQGDEWGSGEMSPGLHGFGEGISPSLQVLTGVANITLGCFQAISLLPLSILPMWLRAIRILGRYSFPPTLSSTDRVKRSFINEQLSAVCALPGCRDWWTGS